MKKIILLTLLIVTFSVLLFFTLLNSRNYKEINYDKYKELYNNNESFILFVGSSQCSHCTIFKKTATRIVKENKVDIFYIDIEKLKEEEYAHINAHFPITSTPTTLIIKNKKELARIQGAQKFEDCIEILEKTKIIKE